MKQKIIEIVILPLMVCSLNACFDIDYGADNPNDYKYSEILLGETVDSLASVSETRQIETDPTTIVKENDIYVLPDGTRFLKAVSHPYDADTQSSGSAPKTYYSFGTPIKINTYGYYKYEPIHWVRYKEDDTYGYYVSKKVIDYQTFDSLERPYHESFLRSYLNNTFCNSIFSILERSILQSNTFATTYVANEGDYSTTTTNVTDKIWMLSSEDAVNIDLKVFEDLGDWLFNGKLSNLSRQTIATEYILSQGGACMLDGKESASTQKSSYWFIDPEIYSDEETDKYGPTGNDIYHKTGYQYYQRGGYYSNQQGTYALDSTYKCGVRPCIKIKKSDAKKYEITDFED